MDYANSNLENLSNLYKAELTDSEFNRLSKFIMTEYGIKMPPEKKIMLQSRLQKRLRALKYTNFKEYIDYLFSPHGQSEEVIHMMDVVSTNKTDFFRESVHFDFMLSEALPDLVNKENISNFNIWSAGCSSGEEPYTIAITMSEFKEINPQISYNIYATDISTKVLDIAVDAIYDEGKINTIPLAIKKKYFLRSKNRTDQKVRLISEIRNKVNYARINLLDLTPTGNPKYHIVFCRNVLIYFDRPTQQKILSSLCSNLIKGGYLFLGHSESISGLELPVKTIKPTVFLKI